MATKAKRRKDRKEFVIDFMGPEFGLAVSGSTRDECERTFYRLFERVSGAEKPPQKDRMVH